MIDGMRTDINQSVDTMKSQESAVGKVSGQITHILEIIDGIAGYVGKVAEMVDMIAVAMQEQSSTANEVSNNMTSIAGVTRQIKDSFSETRSTADELTTIAVELDRMTGWFKV